MVQEFMEEKQREASASAPTTSSQGMRHTLVAVLSIVCLAVWFAPYPSFASVEDVAAQAVSRQELEGASARARLYLAARSVSHFRATKGRLPNSLAEAGVVRDSAIDYRQGPDSLFTLTSRTESLALTYDSRRPAESILGRSEELITKQGH